MKRRISSPAATSCAHTSVGRLAGCAPRRSRSRAISRIGRHHIVDTPGAKRASGRPSRRSTAFTSR
jgi:hypothetical protein